MHDDFTPLDEIVKKSVLSKAKSTFNNGLERAVSLITDPYTQAQILVAGVERTVKFGITRQFLTGNGHSFSTNVWENALLFTVGSTIYEIATTWKHRKMHEYDTGSNDGFWHNRYVAELQHYKIRGIAYAINIPTFTALESFTDWSRVLTIMIGTAPLGALQALYATDVRRRVDAGEELDKTRDKIINSPYRVLAYIGRKARLPQSANAATYVAKNTQHAIQSMFTSTPGL